MKRININRKINNLLSENNIRKYSICTGIVFAISLLTIIAIVCLFNRPIADTFSYFSKSSGSGFWPKLILDMSDGHSGRFLQSLVIWFSHGLFHQKATIILPMFFIILLGILIGLNLKQIVRDVKTKYLLLSGQLISITIVYTLPSFADDVLWFDSMATYFTGIICLSLQILVFVWTVNAKKIDNKQAGFLSVCMLICQFGTESTSMMSVSICLILIASYLLKKNWVKVRIFSIFLLSLLSGLGLMIYGSRSRQGYFHPNRDPIILMKSTFENLNYFFSNIKFWHFTLIIFISIILFYILRLNKAKIKSRTLFFVGISVILVPLLETNFISLFALGAVGPIRNMFLPTYGFIIGGIIISLSILKLFYYWIRKNYILKATIFMIISFMLFISARPFLAYNYQIIQVSSIRARKFDDRSISILQQLSEGKKSISVGSVTLEPLLSEAIDIKGPCLVSWQYNSFKEYYHIPNRYDLIIDGIKMDKDHVFNESDYSCEAIR